MELLPAKPENAMTTAEVVDKLKERDVKRTVATEALAKLATAGTIRRIGEGRRGSSYRYHKPLSEGEKDSSALKDGVPDERKDGLGVAKPGGDGKARIHSSGTSTYIANERKSAADTIQSEDEVFEMAREYFGPNEKGGGA